MTRAAALLTLALAGCAPGWMTAYQRDHASEWAGPDPSTIEPGVSLQALTAAWGEPLASTSRRGPDFVASAYTYCTELRVFRFDEGSEHRTAVYRYWDADWHPVLVSPSEESCVQQGHGRLFHVLVVNGRVHTIED